MLNYLIDYGINQSKKNKETFEELDINDREALQGQINNARKEYRDLLVLVDTINDKLLHAQKILNERTKSIIQESTSNPSNLKRNDIFSTDDEYLELDAEISAYKAGIQMINNRIDFCKSDLRILNSVFYNKF
jgi:hypothetical protein